MPDDLSPGGPSPSTRQASPGQAQNEREEAAEIRQLEKRDREVRAHEQAHLNAAGSLARGPASFTFVTGPDGRRYAVGGEVSIDTSPVAGDPAATLLKAEKIRRAALAPAEPSAQDRQVASEANAMANQARAELLRRGDDDTANGVNGASSTSESRPQVAPSAGTGAGPGAASNAKSGQVEAAEKTLAAPAEAHPAGCPHCAGKHMGSAHRAAAGYGEVAELH